MPILAPSPPARIILPSVPRAHARIWVWTAGLLGSRLPEIISNELGLNLGVWLPLGQTIVLLCLAIAAVKLHESKNVAGFIMAVAAFCFGWSFVVPVIESSSAFQALSRHLDWGAQTFLARGIRVTSALFMVLTLVGSGLGRRELFLKIGNWRAPVQPEPFPGLGRTIVWTDFSALWLLIFGVALPVYLFFTLHPQFDHAERVVRLLPWALVTASLNAANEEFQVRSVFLARLKNVVDQRDAMLISAIIFGIGHYFGHPAGWGGVAMATAAGWIWAKSMIETRGFACAFVMHFVQDMVIFSFLALQLTAH